MYEPWDALQAPRYTAPRTFARLPYLPDLDGGATAAVFGMPWEGSIVGCDFVEVAPQYDPGLINIGASPSSEDGE